MASESAEEGGSTLPMDDDDETLISTPDVEPLKRAWRNEKAAPDILPFEDKLISRVTAQIQLQVTHFFFFPLFIFTLQNPSPFLFIYFWFDLCMYLQEQNMEDGSIDGTDPLSVSLYQMDLDRTLFLLRSYLRIRIQKVA